MSTPTKPTFKTIEQAFEEFWQAMRGSRPENKEQKDWTRKIWYAAYADCFAQITSTGNLENEDEAAAELQKTQDQLNAFRDECVKELGGLFKDLKASLQDRAQRN